MNVLSFVKSYKIDFFNTIHEPAERKWEGIPDVPVPHKNGLELKNPQEIYITIFSLIYACTKNGYVVATSPLPRLKE